MNSLTTYDAIQSDDAFWELVRLRLTAILERIACGQRVIHIAPPSAPFRIGPVDHLHDHPEMTLGGIGKGFMRLNDGEAPILPDTITIIPRGIPHLEECLDTQHPYANICCNVMNDTYSAHVLILEDKRGRCKYAACFKDDRAARSRRYLIDACAAVEKGSDEHDYLMRGLVQASLALMLEAIDGREAFEMKDRLIHMTRMYIDSHLSDPTLCVARIAQVLGYNADYLSNRFHEVTGIRLSAFITEQRMALAARLLTDDSFNISEVARACGYQDPAYFSRTFHMRHGQSPRAWRIAQPHS